ncbi:MAG: hypothetical protein J0M15_14290 [Deltaproteobacteria bacterium]|nr:hypothetical protein [Deltaproteobacteria bacterium]
MKISVFNIIFGLVSMAAAHATEVSPSFECKLPTGEVAKYQTLKDVDLTRPLSSGYGGITGKKTIPLFVNGKGPIYYSLQIVTTRIGDEVHYTFKDRYFLNDTTLKYFAPTYNRNEYVTGEYRSDYAIYRLNCEIKR